MKLLPDDIWSSVCFVMHSTSFVSHRLQTLVHSAHPGRISVFRNNSMSLPYLINRLSLVSELRGSWCPIQHLAAVLCAYTASSGCSITKRPPTGKKVWVRLNFSFHFSTVNSRLYHIVCMRCNNIIHPVLVVCLCLSLSVVCCKQILLHTTPP